MSDAAFESLRLRAEAAVADAPITRRPSYAPPLELTGDLLGLVRGLEWLPADEPPVARLWARFLDPKRNGFVCVGFELRAGTKANGKLMFQTTRGRALSDPRFVALGAGTWSFGPRFYSSSSSPEFHSIQRHQSEIACLENLLTMNVPQQGRERMCAEIAQFRTLIAEAQGQMDTRKRGVDDKNRVVELAAARVAAFAGDADAQMISAGALAGICARCGRPLKDRVSLERGIGPECWPRLDPEVRNTFANALAGMRREDLSLWAAGGLS